MNVRPVAQGEGGQEEDTLRETLKKRTSEQQYSSTTQPGETPVHGVPEEQQPGYYHEDREQLKRTGAVVHEEVGRRNAGGSETRSAPESGTESRTAGEKPSPASRSDEDIASAPESGTR
ncbi:hypothetical protein GPECTOR_14g219 [Gonium pectorale]|uniref:Uncharacterized protein n=1 Tax=Gonium pectorale TaxID=33097 RepID=A0A150GM93_GONPE|nr:hypothetical protein GPECTOR_14g219 [Gonium pectorale]|eukprot:KXZ50976.1 hypothetical protein GPECTOR_14g219 [Gonium pectorale]